MFVTVISMIFKCLLTILLSVTILLLISILVLKQWLQPVKRMYKSDVKLYGKVALITGGSSGIGLETARDLARRGAIVVIASRSEKALQQAVDDIKTSTGNQQVYYKILDLVKFSSIRNFVDDFNQSFDRLDILVNNAGCAGIIPRLSEDGIEKVTQINYVGPFLLTKLLLDKLIACKPSRIVVVSSKANEYHHEFDPEDIAAITKKSRTHVGLFRIYANTKLCNILWAKALAKRLPEGVTVNAVHPGVVMTNIFRGLSGLRKRIFLWVLRVFFKTAEEGAQTTVYLCVAPEVADVSGEYFVECEVAKADELTEDDGLVEKVWENTLKLVDGR